MLRKLLDITGYILVCIVVILIERLLGPVVDGLQLIDTALYGLYLIVLIAIEADTGRRIRILCIPYEIRHHGLILTAGYEGITTDLDVLLDHEYALAVLCCLCSCRHTGSAATDNHDIPGILDRILRLYLEGVCLKCIEVGHAGLLCRIIHGGLQCLRGEGCTGHGIDAGTVCLDHLRDEYLERGITYMTGLLRIHDLDIRDLAVIEGNLHGRRAVIAHTGSGIGTCGKCKRLIRSGRGITTLRLLDGCGHRLLYSITGHG